MVLHMGITFFPVIAGIFGNESEGATWSTLSYMMGVYISYFLLICTYEIAINANIIPECTCTITNDPRLFVCVLILSYGCCSVCKL